MVYENKRKTHRGVVLALAVVASFSQKDEIDIENASHQLLRLAKEGIDMPDFYPIGCGPLFLDIVRFFSNLHFSLDPTEDWSKIRKGSAAYRFCVERVQRGLSLNLEITKEIGEMIRILGLDMNKIEKEVIC